jgi:hypothetical protein
VELAGDPACLFFEELVDVPERGVGVAGGPMGHLERREALQHEVLRAAQHRGPLLGAPDPRAELRHRPVQHGGHIEDAEPVGQRPASQLVAGVQGRLGAACEVLGAACEVLLQSLGAFGL